MRAQPVFWISLLVLILVGVAAPSGAQPGLTDPPDWASPDGASTCAQLGDPVTGEINAGDELSFEYELEPGVYSFVGWVSLDLMSVEMTVRTDVGAVLARDQGPGNMPLCILSIESSATVEVILSAAEERVAGVPGVYALAAAKGKDCFECPAFPEVVILDEWTSIVKEDGAGIMDWQVTEMAGGDSLMLEYDLAPGSYTVIAETKNVDDDIDMYVSLDPETTISKDELPENFAVCCFELDNSAEVTIEIDPWKYAQGDLTTIVVLLARDPEEEP